jgi:hypothetical protein
MKNLLNKKNLISLLIFAVLYVVVDFLDRQPHSDPVLSDRHLLDGHLHHSVPEP